MDAKDKQIRELLSANSWLIELEVEQARERRLGDLVSLCIQCNLFAPIATSALGKEKYAMSLSPMG